MRMYVNLPLIHDACTFSNSNTDLLQNTVPTLSFAAQNQQPERPTAFPLFGKLPTEIRHQIWRYAARGPAVIKLRYNVGIKGRCSFKPHRPVFAVSREARYEAKKSVKFFPANTYPTTRPRNVVFYLLSLSSLWTC